MRTPWKFYMSTQQIHPGDQRERVDLLGEVSDENVAESYPLLATLSGSASPGDIIVLRYLCYR